MTTTPPLLPGLVSGPGMPTAVEASRRLNVAIVIYNPNDNGSVMNTTRRQVEWLDANDIEVTVVTNQTPNGWAASHVETVSIIPGMAARCVNYAVDGATRRISQQFSKWETRNWLAQRRFDDAAGRRLKTLVRTSPIDVAVCVQHFCAHGLKALRDSAGVPFIVVAHGDIFSHPTESFPIPLTRFYRKSARTAYRYADHLVTVGTELRERAIEYGALPQRVTVIPNGMDPDEIEGEPHPAATRRHQFELLYVGRLAPEKGVSVLLDAIGKLDGVSGRLRIVGSGPSITTLQKQAKSLSSEIAIEFTGNVSRAALGSFYRSADVVVIPSFTEAHGLVAVEAATCGVPVIASAVGGLRESVEDGATGLLVPPGNAVALGHAIQKLADSPELRKSMKSKAMQRATSFNWSAQLSRWQSVISDVCSVGTKR